ncbi:MAG: glycosyltransferase family 2 protein [Candidatus Paceibacterota bacterium]|jgi:glycosyltransferase involved in cell wall biosynthesis
MKLSVIIPVYNEEENIKKLHRELVSVMGDIKLSYEIIWVNDGSKDASLAVLEEIAKIDANSKIIDFARNFGQTAAMSAGIKQATGDIIIPMDADLQNDPVDIPKFLKKIEEGYDVVSGWRKNRKDALLLRKVPSWIANSIIAAITGVRIHDYGCSMKAYRRDIIQGIILYGEMHRFIPAYVGWHGGKVTEIVVNHRPRIHGETKYGISRTFRVILDLILIKFLSKYMNRPIHFFGGIGFMSLALGGIAAIAAVYLKLFNSISFITTPLPIFSAMLVIVGVQLIAMGVIAEMLMRVYYESQGKQPYSIKKTMNT